MRDNVVYHVLRRAVGYTNGQQLDVLVCLLISYAFACSKLWWGLCLGYTMVNKLNINENTRHLALVRSTISSTPMWYTKHHTINNYESQKSHLWWKIMSCWQSVDMALLNLQASSLDCLPIMYMTLNTLYKVDEFKVSNSNLRTSLGYNL